MEYKTIQLTLLGAGVFSILICFFMNVGEFSDDSEVMMCSITYAGNIECEFEGVNVSIALGDCNGDYNCNTIKSTPLYGGFSVGLGAVVFLFAFFEPQIGQLISFQCSKITKLTLLGIAILFCMMNPILQMNYKYSDVTLKILPLLLEFIALISYGCSWGLIIKSQQRQGEELLA